MTKSFTNSVFYIKTSQDTKTSMLRNDDKKLTKSTVDVFVPCYVRLNFKKISKINLKQLRAQMVATLVISFLCKNLKKQIIQGMKQKLQITFNEQGHLKLTDEDTRIKCNVDQKKCLLTYTIRDIFPLQMSNDNVIWAPFDTIDLSLCIAIRTFQIAIGNIFYTLKFNCMDTENRYIKFSETGSQNIGQFQLIRQNMRVEYTNSQQKLNQKQLLKIKNQNAQTKLIKMQNFMYAIFRVSVYRLPTTILFTIFLPLWLLALITLALFFVTHEFKDRVAGIATLLVAFTAFIPTIRQRLPPTPKVTFTDIMINSLLINTLLCLIRSFNIRNLTQKQFLANQWKWQQDIIYIIATAVFGVGVIIVMIIQAIFKLIWQPHYKGGKHTKKEQQEKFDPTNWYNQACDEYFLILRPLFRTNL